MATVGGNGRYVAFASPGDDAGRERPAGQRRRVPARHAAGAAPQPGCDRFRQPCRRVAARAGGRRDPRQRRLGPPIRAGRDDHRRGADRLRRRRRRVRRAAPPPAGRVHGHGPVRAHAPWLEAGDARRPVRVRRVAPDRRASRLGIAGAAPDRPRHRAARDRRDRDRDGVPAEHAAAPVVAARSHADACRSSRRTPGAGSASRSSCSTTTSRARATSVPRRSTRARSRPSSTTMLVTRPSVAPPGFLIIRRVIDLPLMLLIRG